MQKVQNYLFLGFAIVVIVFSKQYEISSFKNFYFFKIIKTSNSKGIVFKIERSDDMSGVISYKYLVKYNVDNINYTLSERISPDSLPNISLKDTVSLRYSAKNPKYATLRTNRYVYYELLFSIGLILFEIFLIIKSYKIIFKGDNISTKSE